MEFRSEYPRDYEQRQNEVSKKRYMGSKSEIQLLPQYKRLRDRDVQLRPDDLRKIVFYYETKRIISVLKLPTRLKHAVLENAEKFYKYFKPWSYCRGGRVLIPVSVYITCLEAFIFINRKELSTYKDCTKIEFNRCLTGILRKDDKLRLKIRSEDFRMETILNQLIGLRNHFGLPKSFLKTSIRYLYQYYDKLKNTKETVITARIYQLTHSHLKEEMKPFNVNQACKFLGVCRSVCCKPRFEGV